jgi:hypothetical protein
MNRSGRQCPTECFANAIDLAVPNVLVLGQSSRHRLSPNDSQATKVIPSSSNSQKTSSRNKESHFGCLTIRAGNGRGDSAKRPGAEEIKFLTSSANT